jgi:hypothetical protein
MPPRGERYSSSAETALSAEQRSSIVNELIRVAQAETEKVILDPGWLAEKPYVPLLAMTGYLTGKEDILPDEQMHLKRMMVLEAASIDHRKWQSPSHQVFMEDVSRLVIDEVADFQGFSHDKRKMPKEWKDAANDRQKVYQALPILA